MIDMMDSKVVGSEVWSEVKNSSGRVKVVVGSGVAEAEVGSEIVRVVADSGVIRVVVGSGVVGVVVGSGVVGVGVGSVVSFGLLENVDFMVNGNVEKSEIGLDGNGVCFSVDSWVGDKEGICLSREAVDSE
jgi:hypothetical protein